MKRRTARAYQTRRREMGLMATTHNIMIVLLAELFYRASLSPFSRLAAEPGNQVAG